VYSPNKQRAYLVGKSCKTESENMPKVFYCSCGKRQKYFSDYGEYEDFRLFLLHDTSEIFYDTWRVCTKKRRVYGESTKSILPYLENTLINKNASLPQQIFDQNKKEFRSLAIF
jgi:hypothetical protein